MKRKLLVIVLGLVVAMGIVAAQEDPWWRPLNPQGASAGVGYGTLLPSIATVGSPPAEGELFVQLTANATAQPVLRMYSDLLGAWVAVSPTSGAAGVPSTLATNAVDAADSIWGGTSSLIAEGATANANEITVAFADPTNDVSVSLQDYNATGVYANVYPLVSVANTAVPEAAGAVWSSTNRFIFEGGTADANEITFQAADATSDVNVNLSDYNASTLYADVYPVVNAFDGVVPEAANAWWGGPNSIVFEGATADAFTMTIGVSDPTANGQFSIVDYNRNGAAGSVGAIVSLDLGEAIPDEADAIWFTNGGVMNYEGSTEDAFESQFQFVGDPALDTAVSLYNDGTANSGLGILFDSPWTHGNLPAAQNGTILYCSDCTRASPCAAAGTGAIAQRLNGVWECN